MEGLFNKQIELNEPYQYNGTDYLTDGGLNVNHATYLPSEYAVCQEGEADTGPCLRDVVAE